MQQGQEYYFDHETGNLRIKREQQYWIGVHLEKMTRLLDLQPEESFLDLGCGEGFYTIPLSEKTRVSLGLDFSEKALKVLKQQMSFIPVRLKLCVSSGDALPLSDNSIDKALSNHMLEHVADDTRVIKELYRVLRPKGRALIGIPISYSPQVRLFIRLRRTFFPTSRKLELERYKPGVFIPERAGVSQHVRYYSPKSLYQLLERNGFEVVTAEGVGFSLNHATRQYVRRNRILFSLSTTVGKLFPGIGDGILVLAEKRTR